MQLDVQNTGPPPPQSREKVLAMALAVQANLVQLKVADAKRRGIPTEEHHIQVPSPGFVRAFRETLIDHTVLASYAPEHLDLRTREVWGQFCVLLWLFSYSDPPERASFTNIPADSELRCGTVLEAKHDEIHAIFWLLHFEQRRRHDPDYVKSPAFAHHQKLAKQIPGMAFGKPIEKCTDGELLHAACEYAGMLGAIRWVLDRAPWGDESGMQVADLPF